jgi:hypothetical protein
VPRQSYGCRPSGLWLRSTLSRRCSSQRTELA